MKKTVIFSTALFVFISSIVWADTFGTGDNRFDIDFVTISGSTNPTSGISAGNGFIFTGTSNDYRIGKFEITNNQWNKFKAAYGTVTGSPLAGYDSQAYWSGTNCPVNNVSWLEAAQFIKWLNTSTGHQEAYKFTGTQGTSKYSFTIWDVTDAGYDASNPFRNSNAFYFLPTENEWVKAAYWNGTNLQTYALKDGDVLYQGNGSNGGWNYRDGDDDGPDGPGVGPWVVGSGSEELNGTFDMMGNVSEWMESPKYTTDYLFNYIRLTRGASYVASYDEFKSSYRSSGDYYLESNRLGFRVASIPESTSLLLLALGGMTLRYRRS